MFCRGVIWSVSIFVAVVVATAYSDPDTVTESPRVVAVNEVTETAAADLKPPAGETRLAAPGGVRRPTPTPAPAPQPHSDRSHDAGRPADAAPAACSSRPLNATAVSLLRSLSQEEKDRRLIEAAKEGSVEKLQALLAAGADVGARDGDLNYTALHWAAFWGHVETVRCLLKGGAAVDARNNHQATPLHFAAGSDRTAVVRLLVSSSADPNARDDEEQTPLHWAAERGYRETVVALLEAGADKQARDVLGNTPLDLARQNDYLQLTEILT